MASSATDHLSKVNAFVSTAGNFIDSALDQLDDQASQAVGRSVAIQDASGALQPLLVHVEAC